MAEYYRKELEKNYNEKCEEISNFCFIEDDNKKQTYYETPFGACNFTVPPPPITMNQPAYVSNYPQSMAQPHIQSYNINPFPYGYSIITPDHHVTNPADFDRNLYNQQQFLPFPNTPVSSPYGHNNNPVNYVTQHFAGTFSQTGKKIKEPHIYNSGSTVFDDGNEVRKPFITPSINNSRGYSDFYRGKTFQKPRKYSRYVPPKKEENDADIDIDVSAVISTLKKRSEIKSNFIEIISQFSRLSVYAMEMCRERMSLENILTGYTNSVNNYYLPTVISNISAHIKIIRQSLGYEFYEIWKLIDSLEINFQKDHEKNVREFFRKNLNELEYFENIKVKQKNGEILLSNDKIAKLQTLVADLTDSIRYYSIYITVLQFECKKECKIKMETKNSDLELEETFDFKLQTTEETIVQELQISKLNFTDDEDEKQRQQTELPIQFVKPARGPGF